jgi:hypothetical protein
MTIFQPSNQAAINCHINNDNYAGKFERKSGIHIKHGRMQINNEEICFSS